jgi:hypothetical protein
VTVLSRNSMITGSSQNSSSDNYWQVKELMDAELISKKNPNVSELLNNVDKLGHIKNKLTFLLREIDVLTNRG